MHQAPIVAMQENAKHFWTKDELCLSFKYLCSIITPTFNEDAKNMIEKHYPLSGLLNNLKKSQGQEILKNHGLLQPFFTLGTYDLNVFHNCKRSLVFSCDASAKYFYRTAEKIWAFTWAVNC